MKLLLDTTVLVDALRDRRGRRELLASAIHDGHLLGTTAINFAEIYSGMRPEEADKTKEFLDGLEFFPVTSAIAKRAGRLKWEWRRKGRTLALDDLLIAATALENDWVLMTDNREDFPMADLDLYPFE